MPRSFHPLHPLDPVDDAVRDALEKARARRQESEARLQLYPTPDLEVRATTQTAPHASERAGARTNGGNR